MDTTQRSILYLNIPTFSISVERSLTPTLRDRPTAIAPLFSDRALIWESSSEAKAMGIKKGMPVALATRKCKDLQILEPKPELYQQASNKVESLIKKVSPSFERDKLGHLYIDFTGLHKLHGAEKDLSLRLQKHLKKHYSLESSLGIAFNKLVSKIAAKSATPSLDILHIFEGSESTFLNPKPVQVLPIVHQMEKTILKKGLDNWFTDLNIHHVSDIVQLGVPLLSVIFGKEAPIMYQMALGQDTTPIYQPKQKPSIIEEQILQQDTNHSSILRSHLRTLTEQALFRLRSKGATTKQILLYLRFSDLKHTQSTFTLPEPTSHSKEVYQAVCHLLKKILKRRTRVRFIALQLRQLSFLGVQLSLFNNETPLHLTTDKIKKRFGAHKLVFANELQTLSASRKSTTS